METWYTNDVHTRFNIVGDICRYSIWNICSDSFKKISFQIFFFFLNVVFLKPKKMPMVKVSCLFSSSTFTFPNTLLHCTKERHILTRPEFTRLHFPRLYKDDVVARQRVILNVGVCEASLDQDTIWVSFNFLKCFQGVGSEIFHIYVL